MINNMWYAILLSKEIGKKPLYVKRLNKTLCLWRGKDKRVRCIEDKCCHRGASLSYGSVNYNNVCCPFHGFEYNHLGEVVHIPSDGDKEVDKRFCVESFLICEEFGFVWFWNGDKEKASKTIQFPENLKDKSFSYMTLNDQWQSHYTRCIENQLDVMHVPFVHKTTIGFHANKEIKHLHVETEKTLIRFWNSEQRKTYLEFYFPNTWQNIITDDIRVFAAFAPIDETNTMVYIRYYQKMTTIPILKNIINMLGIKYSRIILNQDKRVVKTQPPYETHLNMGENLVSGDRVIVEYRRMKNDFEKI